MFADIEKAFLQLSLAKPDRDVTRFLWYKDASTPEKVRGNLQTYRFCRVPFGIISSPFLLQATIAHHLASRDTPAARMLTDNIYVDNALLNVHSVSEGLDLYTDAKSLFSSASMNLREWTSNSPELMARLPAEDRATSSTAQTKLLGLLWNVSTDHLSIPDQNVSLISLASSKRDVLHCIARIYDPLGLMMPVTYHGKVFLRKLWQTGIQWDDPLPSPLQDAWRSVAECLQPLSTVEVPRFVGCTPADTDHQLHVFCDASQDSYGCAVYLRTQHAQSQQVSCHLLYSKMRLTPSGSRRKNLTTSTTPSDVSLPRLELLGVVFGSRASQFGSQELKLSISSRTIWTDSKCVLLWLKSTSRKAIFVENRITELRNDSAATFRYVRSADNPADLVTRGLTVPDLSDATLWWHGPSWLSDDLSLWPSTLTTTPADIALAEREVKPEPLYLTAAAVESERPSPSFLTIDPDRFSSFTFLLRVTAVCLKFIRSLLTQRRHSSTDFVNKLQATLPVTSQDLSQVSLMWTRHTQRAFYPAVVSALENKTSHPLVSQFRLKFDSLGLIRCYGRFSHAGLSDDTANPKLLPRRTAFTRLLIRHVHSRLIHAGVAHTLAQVRQEFWIPQGRAEIRSVLRLCHICRRHEGNPFRMPATPAWPRERVTRSLSFEYTGVDYLGPVYIKYPAASSSSHSKLWISLFTCLSTRAIHLEWVHGLSGSQFLNCLRRFVTRRGSPRLLISDNAPQFRLVQTVLEKDLNASLTNPDVHHYLADHGVQWRFTTELAPWQGGFYERLVGLVKRALRKGLGRKLLNFDEFVTFLADVELMLNTRPLTYIGDDISSLQVLTPSSFLSGRSNIALPFDDADADDPLFMPTPASTTAASLRAKWTSVQHHLDAVWSTWEREYLLALRELAAKSISSRSSIPRTPRVGEVVVIADPAEPRRRGSWAIGKVTRLIDSRSDKQVRAVALKTATRQEVHWPVNLLCPLELQSAPDEERSCEFNRDCTPQFKPQPVRPPRRAAAVDALARIAAWTEH